MNVITWRSLHHTEIPVLPLKQYKNILDFIPMAPRNELQVKKFKSAVVIAEVLPSTEHVGQLLEDEAG
eukprot:403069-Pelagomonas_calceolata.AAC.1